MKLDEIRDFCKGQEYKETCDKCKKEYSVLTQAETIYNGFVTNEYLTNVYIKCECGEYVEFTLPVN